MSLVGRRVGHYRILDALGEGGMGEVFLAEDTRLRRPVALKMLGARLRADAVGCERLAREARVASVVKHPGIAVVYETGMLEIGDERRAYIAMEYVAGESLRARLDRGPVPTREALEIARQLADALAEAHASGVVHRDLKPANVVIDGRQRAKLLDFGLASYTPTSDADPTWSGADGLLPAGALAGTLAYMAPEQARGRAVDARADVYGLGALLYELLAGRPPFAGETAVDVLDALLNQPPSPIGHPPDAPPAARALETLVRRMLAKDPRDRPADMAEVRAALCGVDGEREDADELPAAAAVLPFVNLAGPLSDGSSPGGARPEDDWIGTALAEAVVAGLGSIDGLEVASRDRLKEARLRLDLESDERVEAGVPRLARELGVRFVVLGRFQRVGEAVHITARVVDSRSGGPIHATSVDGTMSRIFAAQDRLVAELRRGLRFQVEGGARSGRGDETASVEAYEAFTRGLVNLRAPTRESLDRATAYFERAVSLDPGYAEAHLQLGVALGQKASFLGGGALHERSIASIERSLERRPDHAVAWRELAASPLAAGVRDARALDSARRAVELDPESAETHAALARVHFIGFARFEDAAPGYERALALNPGAGWYAMQLSLCAALLGRLRRAESAARQALVLQEAFLSGRQGLALVGGYVRLGQVAALRGRPRDAVALFRREEEYVLRLGHALAERALIEIHYRVGDALTAAGEPDRGAEALRRAVQLHEERLRLGADDPFTRYYAACARGALGDFEGAAAELERAFEHRRAFALRRARSQPELAPVLERLGLSGANDETVEP